MSLRERGGGGHSRSKKIVAEFLDSFPKQHTLVSIDIIKAKFGRKRLLKTIKLVVTSQFPYNTRNAQRGFQSDPAKQHNWTF